MASLQSLKRKSSLLQAYDVREHIGEDWGEALRKLGEIGIEPDTAKNLLNDALEREQLAGYPPDSDERLDRARAALDTVVALYLLSESAASVDSAPSIDVSLAQIDVDDDVQIRVQGINSDKVQDYARDMAEGDRFPAIVCFFEILPSGNGHKLWLSDGFHRLEAAKSNSLHHAIAAKVVPGDHSAAAEYAATCNSRHGLPLTNADKRKAAHRLLHLHPELPDREISRRVGCSPTTVADVRRQMNVSVQNGQIDKDQQPRTVTRGDQTYEYTPPKRPEYAAIWQIENCLRNYLDVHFGRKGLADFNVQPRVDCLQAMIQFDFDELPNGLHLPDHYRKSDLRQAVNNVLEQIRQREGERLVQNNGVDSGDVEVSIVTWSPASTLPSEGQTGDGGGIAYARGEPFYTALISGSSSSLRETLVGCDLDNTDACAALTRALVNIYGSSNTARRALASRVILDLIQDTIDDLQAEIDLEMPDEASVPLLDGSDAPDGAGCPDCGGCLIRIINSGAERLVCEDCGCVVEPEILEA